MDLQKIKNKEKQFLSLTSLYVAEFDELLVCFSTRWQSYFKYHHVRDGRRRSKPLTAKQLQRPTSSLSTDGDKLFFILYFFKNNHLQEALAMQFEMDQGHISRWIKRLMPVLSQSIKDLHLQPARTMDELVCLFRSRQRMDNPAGVGKAQSVHLDATERSIARNTDQDAQKQDYSGKQHGHTLKNTVLCDEFQFIHFAGFTHRGAISDVKMARQELPTLEGLGNDTIIATKDKGYQGYRPEGVFHFEPYKAARNQPIDGLEELVNSAISSIRIVCEHAIGGVKRLRILKDQLRYHNSDFRDQIFGIACGIHNLRVSRRKNTYSNGALRVRARINLNFYGT